MQTQAKKLSKLPRLGIEALYLQRKIRGSKELIGITE